MVLGVRAVWTPDARRVSILSRPDLLGSLNILFHNRNYFLTFLTVIYFLTVICVYFFLYTF